MANNSMGTKKVEELLVSKSMPLGMQFYVPNYQRGYRWKESQVQQLLNDIKEFDYEKNNEKKFYCLQPLVVTEDKENGWVVIDGQQRLTTLFIILTCIEKMLYKEKAQLYQMNYQNKPQMHDWLEELGDVNNDVQINSDDIDAYHITNEEYYSYALYCLLKKLPNASVKYNQAKGWEDVDCHIELTSSTNAGKWKIKYLRAKDKFSVIDASGVQSLYSTVEDAKYALEKLL